MLAGFVVVLSLNTSHSIHQLNTFQDETNKTAKRVSQNEFKEQLNSLKNVQLIDVRTPGEFNNGTIKGARNIDFNSTTFKDQIGELDKSKPTLIFCHSGGRSARALKMFSAAGFNYVLELEGGYSRWNH